MRQRWDPTNSIDPNKEVPLIERIREANIARNKALFDALHLNEPLLARPSPKKPRAPKAPAAATHRAPTRRSRGVANSGALAPYDLGFDFGYAHALLALQVPFAEWPEPCAPPCPKVDLGLCDPSL